MTDVTRPRHDRPASPSPTRPASSSSRARCTSSASKLLSTGGTAKLLADAGLPVTEVAEHTGFPEMLDGRVKTLHPKIHGGLLARRDMPEHMAALAEHGIATIDLVVVNLYPFEPTVAKPGCTLEEAIENIDIGGPAMVRSAAKNWKDVAVLTDAVALRRRARRTAGATARLARDASFALAVEAFNRIANYDARDQRLPLVARDGRRHARSAFPAQSNGRFVKLQDLRYGENPHQQRRLLPRPAPGARLARHGARSCRARSSRTTTSPTPTRPGNASRASTRSRPA